MKAFYGPPIAVPVPGGTQLTVYLVPVFEGRLVCFDVAARVAQGRWLPWDVLDHQENPYEAASELADLCCGVPPLTLELVDVMSLSAPGSPWELAIIFRCVLSQPPTGDAERRPHIFDRGRFDVGNPLDAMKAQVVLALARDDIGPDLRRWLTTWLAEG